MLSLSVFPPTKFLVDSEYLLKIFLLESMFLLVLCSTDTKFEVSCKKKIKVSRGIMYFMCF